MIQQDLSPNDSVETTAKSAKTSSWAFIWEAIKGSEQSYTTGSINRAIVLLAIPMILEMVMESLFALVDTFFVSKISADAVATVGMTESVITLIYSIAIGISVAPMAMIARFIGEKSPEKASKVALQAIYIAITVALLIGIPGSIFADDILRIMGGSETLIANNVGYTRIMFASNIFIMLLFLLNGIFRGAGDASLAMRSLWLANIINIILDPLFIFGIGPFPELGVQGAAVATTIGRGLGVLFQLSILTGSHSRVKLYLNYLEIDWDIIRRLGRIAATGAGQFLIASASWIFLVRIIAQNFGSEAMAGYTIAIRLIIFTMLPSWGLGNAAATLVGQNLGAKQPDRAAQSTWRAAHFNMIFLAIVAVTYFSFASFWVSFFTTEPAVLEAGTNALQIFAIGYLGFGYAMVISQAFNGAGDTRTPTIVNIICFWMIEIPLGYFLSLTVGWGLEGVCWAVVIAETLMSIMIVILFLWGKWKLVEV
ncbi:MAG: MATE family efflux transporter [Saprospiraceae bacterium]